LKNIVFFTLCLASLYGETKINFEKDFDFVLADVNAKLSSFIYDDYSSMETTLLANNFEIAQNETDFSDKVVVAKRDELVLIIFKGTSDSDDVSVDLNITLTDFSPKDLFDGVKVHGGFFGYTNDFLSKVEDIKWDNEKFSDMLDNPSTKYILTGHSLGGAVAQLFGAKLEDIYGITPENILIYGYGVPAVGNEKWAEVFDTNSTFALKYNYRVVNPLDGVACTNFYTTSYNQIGKYYLLDESNNQILNDTNTTFQKNLCPSLLTFALSQAENHHISDYTSKLDSFNTKSFFTADEGWSLVSIPTNTITQPNQITTSDLLWSWNDGVWSAFSTQESMLEYINEHNIEQISQLNPKEGFWTQSKHKFLKFFDGENYGFDDLTFQDGWNLVGIGEDINTSDIDDNLTIWTYADNKWSLYGKDFNSDVYETYNKLETIKSGSGFWVYKN